MMQPLNPHPSSRLGWRSGRMGSMGLSKLGRSVGVLCSLCMLCSLMGLATTAATASASDSDPDALMCASSVFASASTSSRTESQNQPQTTQWPALTPVRYSAAEASCWMDLAQAQQLRQPADLSTPMWLDVRPQAHVRSQVLQGSVVMALHDVADKPYLRDQSLVLVGTGVDLPALTQACLQLRKNGFSQVKVLLGGERTWQRMPLPQSQSQPATAALAAQVSPQELWLGSAAGLWRIAAVGLSPQAIAQLPMAPELVVAQGTAEAVAQQWAQKWARVATPSNPAALHPAQPPQQWVIVTADSQVQTMLQKQSAKLAVKASEPPLWLAGGVLAYTEFIAQQRLIATHMGARLQRPCGT